MGNCVVLCRYAQTHYRKLFEDNFININMTVLSMSSLTIFVYRRAQRNINKNTDVKSLVVIVTYLKVSLQTQ